MELKCLRENDERYFYEEKISKKKKIFEKVGIGNLFEKNNTEKLKIWTRNSLDSECNKMRTRKGESRKCSNEMGREMFVRKYIQQYMRDNEKSDTQKYSFSSEHWYQKCIQEINSDLLGTGTISRLVENGN